MKKLFILFALMIVAAMSAAAQKNAMMPKETTEQTLMRMENEISEGLVKGDVSAFDKYVSDKAAIVDPMGGYFTKASAIQLFKSGDIKFTSLTPSEMKVTMFGPNTAVVTFISTDKGSYKGMPIDGKTRWVDTFVKMDGKWWCIATAGTAIMEMKQ